MNALRVLRICSKYAKRFSFCQLFVLIGLLACRALFLYEQAHKCSHSEDHTLENFNTSVATVAQKGTTKRYGPPYRRYVTHIAPELNLQLV